jgi:hypothetical protein
MSEITSNASLTNSLLLSDCTATSSMPDLASRDKAVFCLTISSISTVDSLVLDANERTSSATTAKPRPCSPARAASMAAFNANKFVLNTVIRSIQILISGIISVFLVY